MRFRKVIERIGSRPDPEPDPQTRPQRERSEKDDKMREGKDLLIWRQGYYMCLKPFVLYRIAQSKGFFFDAVIYE